MAKKKMCGYYSAVDSMSCDFGGNKPKDGLVYGERCPKNTNSRCEIVPAKPKDVVVKGWAFIGATTKELCISSVMPFCMSVPCVAHIAAKDYARLKGGARCDGLSK